MGTECIAIDGSTGEGGGQILRSSLTLSALTGRPCRVKNIRAGRDKPGLMRQHLTAVQAMVHICGAQVDGAQIGSQDLLFVPGTITAGEYEFRVGTAGSTTLVLQTIMLPLALADGPSRIVIEGGTHNPMAPPFDFLLHSYLPLLNRLGPRVDARLKHAGFFPAGGGQIIVDIEPAERLVGFDLLERGAVRERRARVLVSNLARRIGEREANVLRTALQWPESSIVLEHPESRGPGNVVLIEYSCDHVTEVFTGFGEIRRTAEAVANHAVQQWQRYRRSTAAVGEYLADQLLLPLAIAGHGAFTAQRITRHAETHIDLIQRFMDVPVTTTAQERAFLVCVG